MMLRLTEDGQVWRSRCKNKDVKTGLRAWKALYHEQTYPAYNNVCEWATTENRVLLVAQLLHYESCTSPSFSAGCFYSEWRVVRVCSGRIDTLPPSVRCTFPWIGWPTATQVGDEALLAVRASPLWSAIKAPPARLAQQWGEEFVAKFFMDVRPYALSSELHVRFLHSVVARYRARLDELAPRLLLSDIFCPGGRYPANGDEVHALVRTIVAFVVGEAERLCGRRLSGGNGDRISVCNASEGDYSASIALYEDGKQVDTIGVYLTTTPGKLRLRWNLWDSYCTQYAVATPCFKPTGAEVDLFVEAKQRLQLELSPVSLDDLLVAGPCNISVGGLGQFRHVSYTLPNSVQSQQQQQQQHQRAQKKKVEVFFAPEKQFIAWYERTGL